MRYSVELGCTQEQLRGGLAMGGTFAFWGLMPLYWHGVALASPLEILGHRVVWSVFILIFLLSFQRRWKEVVWCLKNVKTLGLLALSGIIVGCNWLLYIWAVNSGHVLDASLGYFISPLISAFLGIFILGERLCLMQVGALSLALGGVLYQVFSLGVFPVVALGIGGSFAFYGLIRKKVEVRPLPGLFLETSLLFLPALGYLIFLQSSGILIFGTHGVSLDLLLMGCGVVTSAPLMTFAYGARRIRLVTVGLFQYISPSLSFVLGLMFFHESMKPGDFLTFGLIWAALALYSWEAYGWTRRGICRKAF